MGTLLPFVGMVVVSLSQASNIVVTKAALSRGINKYVLIVYSGVFSSLILLPCSFVFNRSARLPPLTFSILCRFFLLGLVQCVINVCAYAGIEYSSPTLSTAMLNLVPAFTFILAVIFRMEKLEWRSRTSQAKTLGTLVSISGAFVVTFYKGPTVMKTESLGVPTHLLIFSPQLKWIIGALLLATEAFMLSTMYILQTMVLKMFPAVFTVILYVNFFNTILSSFYSLILVEDPSAWKLRLDIGLIAVLYSALFGTFLVFTFSAWCLSKAGPLFVSMFKPLTIIFAIIIEVLFLGDALCLGSLIGAIIIVTGFYAVIWGKANEEEKSREESGLGSFKSSSEKVPLLQDRIEDIGVSA
ncbi:hypothetical protein SLEP1_g25350 [Rubroshorea leprosula]|uniref:WAT1-related protein n=1 Tax=Rubroshorea leprosula TaxID=152421 RepID=A0AAV5JU64_9ROSI|nr:hypothetical protein SLEP1_g25350 [Rubroshorea leprosula]